MVDAVHPQDPDHGSNVVDLLLDRIAQVSSVGLDECDGDRAPRIVGIGGSVAVGKSTLADAVVDRLGGAVTVIGTDGFLYSNAVLEARGAIDRKGEPDTYDEEALLGLLHQVRSGVAEIAVPTYSHRTFDVGRPTLRTVHPLVLVEGVNALQPRLVEAYDLAVYLDADETVVKAWFVERFLAQVTDAESDPTSFYQRFVGLGLSERRAMASSVWDQINLPNLRRFVVPTRAHADLVVVLDTDHRSVVPS